MNLLVLRIILTIAGVLSVLCDCHNETVINNDGRLYFEFDVYKIIMIIVIWFM